MAVKTELIGEEIGVLEVQGNLVGGEETEAFHRAIMDLMNLQRKKLIVDLRQVDFVNSSGLGGLISAHTSAVRRGAQLVLCNTNNSVNSLLVITGLNRIIIVKKSREEAVAVTA